MEFTSMGINYQTMKIQETIGPLNLWIECLENLDKTIDQVFKYLEDFGAPELLEELCPYFGTLWPAAKGLSIYLAGLPQDQLQDKAVIELGCGLALPSMVASRLGAKVLATDFHPEVPNFLQRNITLNRLNNISYFNYNWEKESALGPTSGKLFDWVIGSDILYEGRYPLALAQKISDLLKPGGQAIISDPGRSYLANFQKAMENLGLSVKIEVVTVMDMQKSQEIFVLVIHHPL